MCTASGRGNDLESVGVDGRDDGRVDRDDLAEWWGICEERIGERIELRRMALNLTEDAGRVVSDSPYDLESACNIDHERPESDTLDDSRHSE